MSSAPKEEGSRARRRRRRGPSNSNRPSTDVANSPPNRTPRRQTASRSVTTQLTPAKTSSDLTNAKQDSKSDAGLSPKNMQPTSDTPRKSDVNNSTPISGTDVSSSTNHDLEKENMSEQSPPNEQSAKEAKEREERIEQRRKLLEKRGLERTKNLAFTSSNSAESNPGERLSEAKLRQLDSSLKKCTGFLRKVKSLGFTEDSVASLRSEAAQLNLSRYVSEVVTAITESKLRSSDMEHLVLLCGDLHRRYEEFAPQMISSLSSLVIPTSSSSASKDLSTRKAALRLLSDLFLLGIFTELSPISSILKYLMKASKASREETYNCLTLLVSFARYGARSFLPVLSPLEKQTSTAESASAVSIPSWEDDVLGEDSKGAILAALQTYFDSDVQRLYQDTSEELQKAAAPFSRSTHIRTTADDVITQNYETAKQLQRKALSSANMLADTLGRPHLDSASQGSVSEGATLEHKSSPHSAHVVISNPFTTSSRSRHTGYDEEILECPDDPFESSEQRAFYAELTPSHSSAGADRKTPHAKQQKQENGTSLSEESKDVNKEKQEGNSPKRSESKTGNSKDVSGGGNGRPVKESRKKDGEKARSLERVMSRLPNVESREAADAFVRDFIAAANGSRTGLKRVIKALCSVSAQKLNLLPAYSRIAASLKPVYPEVAGSVASYLDEEFTALVTKPDVDEKTLATCIKMSQYIGEYVKFGIVETLVMFELLSLCVKDFSGHRVDMICHLLESCGRFVYLSPASHVRMGNILETVWRLKSVRNLEARHNALVETAYFAVRLSPGSKGPNKKRRPPLHEYVRHLIYFRLDASNISWVHNQFLKMPWDTDLEDYVIKKFVKISRARYSTIPYVSTLIAAFQKQKPELIIGVVDALLEAVRSGMEKNDGRDSQKRIAEMHLIGEMHKCGVVDETVVYNVLYQLITLGHESANSAGSRQPTIVDVPTVGAGSGRQTYQANGDNNDLRRGPRETYLNAPDPPGDFFRIQLACLLLETCGRVLVASSRRKLEVFWVFLERYMFCKAHQAGQGDLLPLHIDHIVGDLFESILQKPPRRSGGKEGRISSRRSELSADGGRTHLSGGSLSSSLGPSRNMSLEDALLAVSRIERSRSDSAFISIPGRDVVVKSASSALDNLGLSSPRRDMNELFRPSPGSGIRGNFKDGFVTTPVGNHDISSDQRSEQHRRIHREGENGTLQNPRKSLFSDETRDRAPGEHTYDDEDEFRVADDAEQEDEDDTSDITADYELGRGKDDIDDGSIGGNVHGDAGNDEDDEDEDDDDDNDNDDEEAEEEDDGDIFLSENVARPRTEEEDAFAKELAAVTAAAVQGARASSSRVTKFHRMAIPMSLMTQKLEEEKAAAAAQTANTVNDSSSSEGDEMSGPSRTKKRTRGKSVEFKMLVRRGGKSQLQGLHVPASSAIAVAAKESEFADAARHEETKRLVLGSSAVLNDESEDLDEELPLRAQQHAREKQESIRQQRHEDEMELLSTLYRVKPRR